jgi:quercetin dioxygenase-like cupin family protein
LQPSVLAKPRSLQQLLRGHQHFQLQQQYLLAILSTLLLESSAFDKGKKFSMHYHVQKKETWYVAKGRFILNWIEIENGTNYSEYLEVGDVITNERGEPHQLVALQDSEVFEVSTRHYDEDSFRICKGD